MGTFLTNLHVRSEDQDAVEMALADADALPALVSDPRGGWVTVYPAATESQELEVLDRLGSALSGALETTVIAFLVHDSDVFLYGLFERGEVRDRYDSDPGYFDGQDDPPAGGDVAALLPLAAAGTTEDDLRRLLHERAVEESPEAAELRAKARASIVAGYEQMAGQLRGMGQALPALDELLAQADGDDDAGVEDFAERLAARLAQLLGIDEARSLLSYNGIAATGKVPDGLRLVEAA